MPEFPGRLRTPRLASAPATPAVGELYYDTATSTLLWWNGTVWKSGGGGTTDVHVGTAAPSPRVGELLWIDTDAVGPVATGGPLVTSLPAQPVDGQECYYVASGADGVVWHLIYRAADPSLYKWQVVGGSPLFAEVVSSDTFNNGAFVAPSPVTGPSVALPLGGDYDVEIGARFHVSANASVLMSYDIGGTAASDADAIATTIGATGWRFHESRPRRKTGLGAVTLTTKYRNTVSVTVTVDYRWIRATPVRVG